MHSKLFLSSFLKPTVGKGSNGSSSIPIDVLAAYLAFNDNFLAERELDHKLKTIEKERILRIKELRREVAALKNELAKHENQFMKCHRVFSVETFISESPMKNYTRNLHLGPRPSKAKMAPKTLEKLRKLLQDLAVEEIALSFFPRPKGIKTTKESRPHSSKPNHRPDTAAKARKYSRVKSAPPRGRSNASTSCTDLSLEDSNLSISADTRSVVENVSFLLNQTDLKLQKRERVVATPPCSPKLAWSDKYSSPSPPVRRRRQIQTNDSRIRIGRAKSAVSSWRQQNTQAIEGNRPSTASVTAHRSSVASKMRKHVHDDAVVSSKSSSRVMQESSLSPKQEAVTVNDHVEGAYSTLVKTEMIHESEEIQFSGPIPFAESCKSTEDTKTTATDSTIEKIDSQSPQDMPTAEEALTIPADFSASHCKTEQRRTSPPTSGHSYRIGSNRSKTKQKEMILGVPRKPRPESGDMSKARPADLEHSKTASSSHTGSSETLDKTLRKIATARRQAVFHQNTNISQKPGHSCRRFTRHEKAPAAKGLPIVRGKRVSLFHARNMILSATLFRQQMDHEDKLRGRVHQFVSTQ